MRSALKRAAPNGTSRQKIAPFSLQAVLHRAGNAPQELSTPPPLTTTLSIKISACNGWMESTAASQQAHTTARNWAESKQAQPRSPQNWVPASCHPATPHVPRGCACCQVRSLLQLRCHLYSATTTREGESTPHVPHLERQSAAGRPLPDPTFLRQACIPNWSDPPGVMSAQGLAHRRAWPPSRVRFTRSG